MRKSYVYAGLFAVAVAGWVLSGNLPGDDIASDSAPSRLKPQKPVVLTKVRIKARSAETMIDEIVLLGRTEASRSVEIKAETAGRVVALMARKGDKLNRGDVIARLAMDDRQAQLNRAKGLLSQRQIEYQAARELSQRNFRSKTKLAEAKAELDSAKAYLAAIQLDIRRTTILAPFAGVLDGRPVEIGDFVTVNSAIARMVDLTPLFVVGNVTERDVGKISPKGPAGARLIDGTEIVGRVRYVSSVAEPTTRTFRVEIETANADGKLVAGLTAELRIPLGEVKAHKLSPAVLTLSAAGVVGVKVVGAGDEVKFLPVEILADGPDGIWLSGLPRRIRLITVGQEFVRDGQIVAPVTVEPVGKSPGPEIRAEGGPS